MNNNKQSDSVQSNQLTLSISNQLQSKDNYQFHQITQRQNPSSNQFQNQKVNLRNNFQLSITQNLHTLSKEQPDSNLLNINHPKIESNNNKQFNNLNQNSQNLTNLLHNTTVSNNHNIQPNNSNSISYNIEQSNQKHIQITNQNKSQISQNKSQISQNHSQKCNQNYPQKQQKQSSNDGLNSQRSYPSSSFSNDKQNPQYSHINSLKNKSKSNKHQLNSMHLSNSDIMDQEDNLSEDSRLNYDSAHVMDNKTSFSLLKLFFIICKKQYFFEVIRIFIYAFISITIFAYVLDQNKQKKQFYEAFYSSQQITISKQINGVFPPLFGAQNDIINHTWILQTYNPHLTNQQEPNQNEQNLLNPNLQNQENTNRQSVQLLFEFKALNLLYIKTNKQTCVEQLKFKWKTFDYNMRIYEILESDFEKIDQQTNKSCFPNKKYIQQKMREISLWTIDWQSKQLYLLSQPFRQQQKQTQQNQYKTDKWNQLIVLKKQSFNV